MLATIGIAQTGHAACTVSSDADAVARPVSATDQGDAHMVVAMTMLPRLFHIDYAAATKKPSCDLGPLDGVDYELFGDDRNGRRRTALARKSGEPVAMLTPYVDIMKALAASKAGGSATTEGYLLATVTKTDFTGWRYYTGMPDAAVLKHDMADALAGRGKPIFRSGSDGKTAIFVPGG